jgi:hypothetical protein
VGGYQRRRESLPSSLTGRQACLGLGSCEDSRRVSIGCLTHGARKSVLDSLLPFYRGRLRVRRHPRSGLLFGRPQSQTAHGTCHAETHKGLPLSIHAQTTSNSSRYCPRSRVRSQCSVNSRLESIQPRDPVRARFGTGSPTRGASLERSFPNRARPLGATGRAANIPCALQLVFRRGRGLPH